MSGDLPWIDVGSMGQAVFWLVSLGSAAFLAVVIGVAEWLVRSGKLAPATSRRLVHTTVGLAAAVLPALFSDPGPFYPVAAAALLLALVDGRAGRIRAVHGVHRRTIGTASFVIAFVVGAVLCWDLHPELRILFTASFAVLALADPAAAIVGTRFARDIRAHEKSLAGSAGFFFVAFVALCSVYFLTGPGPFETSWGEGLAWALGIAVAATAAEFVARRGWDNLTVVVSVTVTGRLVLPGDNGGLVVLAMLASAAFFVLSLRLRTLDRRGGIAAALLGAHVVLMGGWKWIVPGLLFFATSSALSRVGRGRKRAAEGLLARGSQRDIVQVLANGGVAWAALFAATFLVGDEWFLAFAGAFAAATADTWGTELGMLSRREPVSIRTRKPAAAGTSGCVSWPGTISSIAGAGLIALSAAFFAGAGFRAAWAMLILVAGLAGSTVDTVLGGTVQAQYEDYGGRVTERANGNRLVRGWRWITNDVVNLMATATGALIALGGALVLAP